MSFELTSDGKNWVTAADLASHLGVTKQTVYNWTEAGYIHPSVDDQGARLWDLDSCRDWYQNERRFKRKGGRRAGAGRKRRRPSVESVTAKAVHRRESVEQAKDTLDEVRTRVERGEVPDDALELVDVLHLSTRDLETLARLAWRDGGLRRVQMSTLNDLLGYQERFLKVEKERGRFVDRNDVARGWGRQIERWKRIIEGMPSSMTTEIMARLNLDPALEVEIRRVAREVIDGLLRDLEVR